MVFSTVVTCVRAAKPDKYWRRRRTFRLSAHFYGRNRNCYRLAVRRVHKSLEKATRGRKLKAQNSMRLWDSRLAAGCAEHDTTLEVLRQGLMRCHVQLNRKVLTDLAIWEPRSFKSLVDLSKAKVADDRPRGLADLPDRPDHVITRGML